MRDILQAIVDAGGKPYFIGGCVRDELFGYDNKDVDIEVFNLSSSKLTSILERFGKVDSVGESFGVIKLTVGDTDYDFSLPRKENRVGVGHKEFEIEVDSSMTLEEAASRRDFTFNSISKDFEGNYVDPFGGINDFKNRTLKHTSDKFSEDALRVLRGFQFCGRFNLIPHHDTILLCRDLKVEFDSLSKERVWEEFKKWALKSINPKAGLDFLVMTGWIDCFPELRNILGIPQEYEWHPEGEVLTHSGYVCNAMQEICEREKIEGERKLVLMLAALCHDLGKASTTCIRKGRISAPKHDMVGGPLTRSFLLSIKCPNNIIDLVVPLVENHMAHINGSNDKIVRKLAARLGKANIRDLVLLMEADASGRPPLKKGCPENASDILRRAINLGCADKPLEKIVNGRDIIDVVPPSKELGELISWLYKKQLEGKFNDLPSGLQFVRQHPIYQKHLKMQYRKL
jgi:tRNA nucleotidyltransferase (CCA-adding enzyme)